MISDEGRVINYLAALRFTQLYLALSYNVLWKYNLHNRNLFSQSQQWKHQDNVSNLLKVYNKGTMETPG